MPVARRVMGRRFVITDHALDRFVERQPELADVQSEEARRVLLGELDNGVPFGYQRGRDELQLLPSGLVAAVAWLDGVGIVKTVLTKDHAIANMESMGAVLRRFGSLPRPPARVVPEPDPHLEAAMRRLAEQHLGEALTKKERNARLREIGIDPAGHAGDVYRAAIKAARAAADRDRALKKPSGAELDPPSSGRES